MMFKTNEHSLETPQTLGVSECNSDDKTPVLFMMIGLPGSGKSTYAKEIAADPEGLHPVILSSDELRKELFGDDEDQSHNAQVFDELHKRIRENLQNGVSVIYDATNIDKKRRVDFLQSIKKIDCIKTAIAVMTPYDVCLERCKKRDRKVPEYVIRRMLMNYAPPHIHEGFDYVHFDFEHADLDCDAPMKYSLCNLSQHPGGFFDLDHENKHHRDTVGVHCFNAMMYLYFAKPNHKLLQIAALLHDIGKPFTKTKMNKRREFDGDYHYYQHHCVGAYESLFYLIYLALTENERAYIANLIYYHMHPYMSWKQSEKAKLRDMRLIGEDMFADVMTLHEADVAAH